MLDPTIQAEEKLPHGLPSAASVAVVDELDSLHERNEQLELLSDVGVALSGSFDIKAILRITHDAARRLTGAETVEVLYFGCPTINSRPLAHPDEPSPHHLPAPVRESIRASFENGDSLSDEPWLIGRRLYPMRYQNEHLGLLLISGDADSSSGTARLMSILTLQAATALRNIHLTQERIHFERLSAVGRMIGSIVHDFRSPLTALRGFAGMLTGLELSEDERKNYGGHVMEECDRLNKMVDELLEFTRGGRSPIDPEWTSLSDYLEELSTRFRSQFGSTGVAIELDAGCPGEARIDRERMDRALWNVVANAVQATPPGKRVVLRAIDGAEGVTIEIVDEGSGIPEEIRHRIFEPFFSYGKSRGTGLGMVTAQKIAEAHGGRLEIESEVGAGTVARFVLPGPAAESTAPANQAPSSN